MLTPNIELENYSICFIGKNEWSSIAEWIERKKYSSHFILTDSNTLKLCYPIVQPAIEKLNNTFLIETRPGEIHKNLATVETIWDQLIDNLADRNSCLINLGGGVIGDLGGFSASTYKRGIDFIQIPTSLLAMVDASVGGKTGFNRKGIKNSIGSFSHPSRVFIFPEFLKTLDSREILSGMGEMIKHALIGGENLWDTVKRLPETSSFLQENWIRDTLQVKKDIVELDFRESGIRKKLNVGHTTGHAIESLSQTSEHPLRHGGAVAIGIAAESYLSNICGLMTENDLMEILTVIRHYFYSVDFPQIDFTELLRIMSQDKKNRNGDIVFSLIKSPGDILLDFRAKPSQISQSVAMAMEYFSNGDKRLQK